MSTWLTDDGWLADSAVPGSLAAEWDDFENSLPPFELPVAAQLMVAAGVAVLLSPLIVFGVAVNAWRRFRR